MDIKGRDGMKALLAIVAVAFAAHAATPTFNKDIAPILYQNCATCHRPGEVAPFSLLTYSDAAKKAGLLAIVTKSASCRPGRPSPATARSPTSGGFPNNRSR
jgi:mono/diheme cytochrome c family protein